MQQAPHHPFSTCPYKNPSQLLITQGRKEGRKNGQSCGCQPDSSAETRGISKETAKGKRKKGKTVCRVPGERKFCKNCHFAVAGKATGRPPLGRRKRRKTKGTGMNVQSSLNREKGLNPRERRYAVFETGAVFRAGTD